MPSSVLVLSDQDRATLESWTRCSTVSAGQRERAEIVLAVADGTGVSGASRTLGVSRPTVIKWRDVYNVLEKSIDACEDACEAIERMWHKAG